MNRPIRHKSAGVAMVTAIFMLVVLAGLGVAVISLTTSQQAGAVQDEQGTRAYLAARAGLDWALYRALESQPRGEMPSNLPNNLLGCPAEVSFALPADSSLAAFTVTVKCDAPVPGMGSRDANDPTHNHVLITVTACNSPGNGSCLTPVYGPDYVQRVLRAQL